MNTDRQKSNNKLYVMGYSPPFLSINRGVPQGTILGPILFLIMVSDIISVDNSWSLAVKYADDTALSTHRSKNYDRSNLEVNAINGLLTNKWLLI